MARMSKVLELFGIKVDHIPLSFIGVKLLHYAHGRTGPLWYEAWKSVSRSSR